MELRTFKTYQEMRAAHQEDYNNFPLGFCFSEEQYKEMMRKWGLKEDHTDDDKICFLSKEYPGLGFIRKCDIPAFNELNKRQREEEKIFNEKKKNLIEMFEYEMANHEYCITYNQEEVLEACGIDKKEFVENKTIREAFAEARKSYLASAY